MKQDPIPVTVLTGFLGSGKTTILSRLVQNPDFADTAIIVNEFGEIGLDHVLIEASDERIVDLSCGCICCTIRGDLVSTLVDLYERRKAGEIRRFRRVVLETTGLADPAPIIHTLMQEPLVFERYHLARVVTAVDAVNGMTTFDCQPEAVKQAAVADALLVTKTDIAKNADAVAALEARLSNINSGAECKICVKGETDPALLFSGDLYDPADKGRYVSEWLTRETASSPHEHKVEVTRHGDGIHTFSLSRTDAVSRGGLGAFMQMLADQKGDDLLRLKGLVLLTEDLARPAVVHGVQHVIHPIRRLNAWPDDTVETRLVFIVRDVEKQWVEDLWDRIVGSAFADLVV
ncbi:MAG: GTP-binding protein [Rhodospirillaceae bacterium TMED63]|nr:GTP-binding protein [Rhodospirillaceae bacterium]RPG02196.1 MAG: GTP-binding protein [Rhodospirillaceae bacterium TMED63]